MAAAELVLVLAGDAAAAASAGGIGAGGAGTGLVVLVLVLLALVALPHLLSGAAETHQDLMSSDPVLGTPGAADEPTNAGAKEEEAGETTVWLASSPRTTPSST